MNSIPYGTTAAFWREVGEKAWRKGWIVDREVSGAGTKVQIGPYNGAHFGPWYDLCDVEIEPRRP